MHQHPRTPPASASPASSPWTNPQHTNNQRDPGLGHPRADTSYRSSSERLSGQGDTGDVVQTTQTPTQIKESRSKLNQIIQNYHTKAALIIIQSRIALPPAYMKGTDIRRVNKWFNVEIDETDVLREDLHPWKTCDAVDSRPPPLIIETLLDTAALTHNQTLVIIDDQGKRWDVAEALNEADVGGRSGRSTRRTEVILERWRIELGDSAGDLPPDLGSILPTVYKKSIVLFRSLFTYSKFLPAWKFSRKTAKLHGSNSALRVQYRIVNGRTFQTTQPDGLTVPLHDGAGRVCENFSFDNTESPAGPFSVQVTYRTSCEFRVDDSEALLSSRFMGIDERFLRPSLAGHDSQVHDKEVGSLPAAKGEFGEKPDRSQAYGSLSTFHQPGVPVGSSPLSALRAARDFAGDSPAASPPLKQPPSIRSAQGSKSSLRSVEGIPDVQRRPSVSFMPFKAPSLSASPSPIEQASSHPQRSSLGRTSAISQLAQARNPSNASALSSSALRYASNPSENAIASSTSGSPKPAPISRYSSSFGHRRGRLSSGGGSKTEDDNNSSGKGSLASSVAQPGSGLLTEVAGASSSSLQTDDDNISDFLKMLDMKKDLKSFHAPLDPLAADASTRRTSAALSKFQRMRDSNAALSDSMSSSLLLHRSSSSSSRQLSSVPPMIAGTSASTSSSPGKPISPHTPHTPAIPSRLSANSIADYQPRRSRSHRSPADLVEGDTRREDTSSEDTTRDPSSNAIDIPTSPRPFLAHNRRSSSVAMRNRTVAVEDETGDLLPFGIRSASMGADDRPPLSLSALLGLQEAGETPLSAVEPEGSLEPGIPDSTAMSRQHSSSLESREEGQPVVRGSMAGYRSRLSRGGGRGLTPPQGSFSSSAGDRGSGSGTSEHRGGRYSFTRQANFEEDEPLLFAMSELGTQAGGRRSIEETRGGGDSVSSSRRGSRRGGLWG